jgi:hypothetical protein
MPGALIDHAFEEIAAVFGELMTVSCEEGGNVAGIHMGIRRDAGPFIDPGPERVNIGNGQLAD